MKRCAAPPAAAAEIAALAFATYNIRGLTADKAEELSGLAEALGTAYVLGVQETRKTSSQPLAGVCKRFLRTVWHATSPAVARVQRGRTYGSGGLLTLVSAPLRGAAGRVRDTPAALKGYVLEVTLALSPHPLVVLNTYAPPVQPAHAEVLRLLRGRVSHWQRLGYRCVVLGDFNAALFDSDRYNTNPAVLPGNCSTIRARDVAYRAFVSSSALGPALGSSRPASFVGHTHAGQAALVRIDDVLLCGSLQAIASAPCFVPPGVGYQSDHRPLQQLLSPPSPWVVPAAVPAAGQAAGGPATGCDLGRRPFTSGMVFKRLTQAERAVVADAFTRASAAVQAECAGDREVALQAIADDLGTAASCAELDRLAGAAGQTIQRVMGIALADACPARLRSLLEGKEPTPLPSGSRCHRTRAVSRRLQAHLRRSAAMNDQLAALVHSSEGAEAVRLRVTELQEALRLENEQHACETAALRKKVAESHAARARQRYQHNQKQYHQVLFGKHGESLKAKLVAVRDKLTGGLTSSPDSVRRAVGGHYADLASAPHIVDPAEAFPWLRQDLDPITLPGPHAAPAVTLAGTFSEEVFDSIIGGLPYGKAPGPDDLVYEELRWLCPDMRHDLFLLYRAFMAHGYLPAHWKTSKTFLLYKKGDPHDPGNYRPISLANVLYKLYTACLHRGLADIAARQRIISDEQNGFMAQRDTANSLHALLSTVEDAHVSRGELFVLYLDLKNAFNTVPHDRLLLVMRQLGFPADAVAIVQQLYQGQRSCVITPYGDTDFFDIERGTIQGDTLSPFLFVVFMEPLLRWLRAGGHGYRFSCPHDSSSLSVLSSSAYADDLVIMASSVAGMQTQIHKYAAFVKWAGMETGIGKCALTGLFFDKDRLSPCDGAALAARLSGVSYRCLGDSLGAPFPFLAPTESYKYLGVWVNMALDWGVQFSHLRSMVTEHCQVIAADRHLYPSQRLRILESKVIGELLYPAFAFCFSPAQLQQIYRPVMRLQKRFNDLSNSVPSEMVSASQEAFGFGLPSLDTPITERCEAHLSKWLTQGGMLTGITRSLFGAYYARCGEHPVTGLPNLLPAACTLPTARRIQWLNALRLRPVCSPAVLNSCQSRTDPHVACPHAGLDAAFMPASLLPVLQLHGAGLRCARQMLAAAAPRDNKDTAGGARPPVSCVMHTIPAACKGLGADAWAVSPLAALARYWSQGAVPLPSSQQHKQGAFGVRPGWDTPASMHTAMQSLVRSGPMPLSSGNAVLRVQPGIRMHTHTGHRTDWDDPMHEVFFDDGDSYRVHVDFLEMCALVQHVKSERRARARAALREVDVRLSTGAHEEREYNALLIAHALRDGKLHYLVRYTGDPMTRAEIVRDLKRGYAIKTIRCLAPNASLEWDLDHSRAAPPGALWDVTWEDIWEDAEVSNIDEAQQAEYAERLLLSFPGAPCTAEAAAAAADKRRAEQRELLNRRFRHSAGMVVCWPEPAVPPCPPPPLNVRTFTREVHPGIHLSAQESHCVFSAHHGDEEVWHLHVPDGGRVGSLLPCQLRALYSRMGRGAADVTAILDLSPVERAPLCLARLAGALEGIGLHWYGPSVKRSACEEWLAQWAPSPVTSSLYADAALLHRPVSVFYNPFDAPAAAVPAAVRTGVLTDLAHVCDVFDYSWKGVTYVVPPVDALIVHRALRKAIAEASAHEAPALLSLFAVDVSVLSESTLTLLLHPCVHVAGVSVPSAAAREAWAAYLGAASREGLPVPHRSTPQLTLVVANAAGVEVYCPEGGLPALRAFSDAQWEHADAPAGASAETMASLNALVYGELARAAPSPVPVPVLRSSHASPDQRCLVETVRGSWSELAGWTLAVDVGQPPPFSSQPRRFVDPAAVTVGSLVAAYTDGSIQTVEDAEGVRHKQAGAAVCWVPHHGPAPQLHKVVRMRYEGLQNSYLAELVAFLALILSIPVDSSAGLVVQVFTDSLSGLYRVRDYLARPYVYAFHPHRWLLERILREAALRAHVRFEFYKVRAHGGVPGNEAVDEQAKEAARGGEAVEAPVKEETPGGSFSWTFEAPNDALIDGVTTVRTLVPPTHPGGQPTTRFGLTATASDALATKRAMVWRDTRSALEGRMDNRRYRLFYAVHGQHPEHLEVSYVAPAPGALDPLLSNVYARNHRAPWYPFILKARADDCYTWKKRNLWQPKEYPNPFCPHCLAAGVQVEDTVTHWLSGAGGGSLGICRAQNMGTLVPARHDGCLAVIVSMVLALLAPGGLLAELGLSGWVFHADLPGHRVQEAGATSRTLPPSLTTRLLTEKLRRLSPDLAFAQGGWLAPSCVVVLDQKVPVEHRLSAIAEEGNVQVYRQELAVELSRVLGCPVHVVVVAVGARATVPYMTRTALLTLLEHLGLDVTGRHKRTATAQVSHCVRSMMDVVARCTALMVQSRTNLSRGKEPPALPKDISAMVSEADRHEEGGLGGDDDGHGEGGDEGEIMRNLSGGGGGGADGDGEGGGDGGGAGGGCADGGGVGRSGGGGSTSGGHGGGHVGGGGGGGSGAAVFGRDGASAGGGEAGESSGALVGGAASDRSGAVGGGAVSGRGGGAHAGGGAGREGGRVTIIPDAATASRRGEALVRTAVLAEERRVVQVVAGRRLREGARERALMARVREATCKVSGLVREADEWAASRGGPGVQPRGRRGRSASPRRGRGLARVDAWEDTDSGSDSGSGGQSLGDAGGERRRRSLTPPRRGKRRKKQVGRGGGY